MSFLRNIFLGFIVISFSILQAKPVPDSFADLAEKLMPSVVNISTTQTVKTTSNPFPFQFPPGSPFGEMFKDFEQPRERKASSLGSGFIIKENGTVITNNHVIANAEDILIRVGDKEYGAEVIGADPYMDLAVLKMKTKDKFKPVRFGDSSKARVGDWVVAIGNPFGLGGTVTAGIISALGRNIGSGPYDHFIQTDAPINKGNSGGPLFNIDGEVIGINSAIISQTGGSIGLGFAIPSNSAKKIVQQLKDFGRTKRGWLGVQIQPVSKDFAESLGLENEKGAFVSNVNPKGPSKTAGIEAGDVILRFNDIEIVKMTDLPRVVAESDVGSIALVEVWRKNKKIIIEVELGELPEQTYVSKKSSKIENKINEKIIKSLGITVKDENQSNGVTVTKVESDEINLNSGDIILEVNREVVDSMKSFTSLVEKYEETGRSSLLLKILRDEETSWVTIKFVDN